MLIIFSIFVGFEFVGVGVSEVIDVFVFGSSKVVVYVFVEGEDGGGGINFSILYFG